HRPDESSVDLKGAPGNEGCPFGEEKRRRVAVLLRLAQTPKRYAGDTSLPKLLHRGPRLLRPRSIERLHALRVESARDEVVDPYPGQRIQLRKRAGEGSAGRSHDGGEGEVEYRDLLR